MTTIAESVEDVHSYLSERAAAYGGTAGQMLDRTPVQLWDSPTELRAYWAERDLSHIFPQSDYPELADDWDNIIAEDRWVNRGRGAEILTQQEMDEALRQNILDAEIIEADYTDDSVEFAEVLADLIA